jgi:hypothetical protein
MAMNDIDAVRTLLDLGATFVFLWLYLQERKRSSQIQEERVKDLKEEIYRLTGWDRVESNQDVKTQHVDSKLELLRKL